MKELRLCGWRYGRLVHPGEVLLDTFMRPNSITQNALARALGVPPRRINEIVLGKRAITADTAVGLEGALGMKAEFWLQLQAEYDADVARRRLAAKPRSVKPLPPLEEYDPAFDSTPW